MDQRLWLPVVVGACLCAGIGAFLAVSPPQPATAPDPAGSWDTVLADGARGRLDAAATAWQQRVRVQHASAAVRGAATRWLTGLVQPAAAVPATGSSGGATTPATATAVAVRERPTAPSAAQHLADIAAWARTLPADLVDVTTAAPTFPGEPGVGEATVVATLSLRVPQALHPSRTLDVPVTLTLTQQAASPWAVADAVAAHDGLRVLRAPAVARRDQVLVLADRDRPLDAQALAGEAALDLAHLHDRYAAVAGSPIVTIAVVDDAAQAARLLGDVGAAGSTAADAAATTSTTASSSAGSTTASQPGSTTAAPSQAVGNDAAGATPDAASVTYDSGDVALLWNTYAPLSQGAREAAVLRAMTRVALLPLQSHASAFLLDGIAAAEQSRLTGTTPDLLPALRSWRRGDLRYLSQLHDGRAEVATTDAVQRAATDGAAWATVTWLQRRYGRVRFVTFLARLRGGTSIDDALRDEFTLAPDELERGVRASVSKRLRATP